MNIKKKTIYSVFIIFFINAFLVYAYYEFFLIERINDNISKTSLKYENEVNKFIGDITASIGNDLESVCKNITDEYNSILIIKDENDKILYSNEKDKDNRPFYITTRIIEKDSEYYILNYYDNTDTSLSSYLVIRDFIIFELILSIIIIVITFILVNLNVISPITKLQKDLKNYKVGIIPKRRKVETSIDEIQNNFIELIDEIEVEKQKQNRIIASISHDIKTPLTSIMGYASRLETKDLNDETKKNYIKKIYNKSLNLKEIVEEFDDYLSCNIKSTLKLESYKIKDLLELLEKDYKDELKEKNIEFKIKSKVKNDTIIIDLAKIKRVFSNIITNSVNHLNGKCGIIIIECKSSQEFYEFSVSDNAGGVKKQHLSKLFEPLYTTDPSRKIPGLGLSICKEIIEIHKGKIYAVNNDMGGLSICFSIKK